MSTKAFDGPRLVVLSAGPLARKTYAVHTGTQLVGRGHDAQIDLNSAGRDHAGISRRHAQLQWDRGIASIVDVGSRNGTAVNGRRVIEPQELRHGDVIRLGALELRFELPHGRDDATATHPAYRVSNAMDGVVHGDLQQAGRDIDNRNWTDLRLDGPDPMDELFQGRGMGRLLIAVGLVVALAGFAGWMYIILHGGTIDDPGFDPFDKEIAGLPAPMVAFGSFLAGGIIMSLGVGLSRAARERGRELQRRYAMTGRRAR